MKEKLTYSTKNWNKLSEESKVKHYFEDELEYLKHYDVWLEEPEKRDYIYTYDGMKASYIGLARRSYIEGNDIELCRGYFFLAAKATEMSQLLYSKGITTRKQISAKIENGVSGTSGAFCAIIANDYDLALSLAAKGTVVEALIKGDFHKAKNIVRTLDEKDDMTRIYQALSEKDPVQLEECIVKRVKTFRRLGSRHVTIIDFWSAAIIKLARKYGIDAAIDIVEIPSGLLEDKTVDENAWKLIGYEKMQKFL